MAQQQTHMYSLLPYKILRIPSYFSQVACSPNQIHLTRVRYGQVNYICLTQSRKDSLSSCGFTVQSHKP